MITIGFALRKFAPDEKIAIIHDHTGHDGGILTCFQSMLSEPRWQSRPFFITIAPMKWQDCIQQQPLHDFEEKNGGMIAPCAALAWPTAVTSRVSVNER